MLEEAQRLAHTIRLLCAARQTAEGLLLSVRPALIAQATILAGGRGAYNASGFRPSLTSGWASTGRCR